jgi:uncharacterized protein DUF5753
MSGTALARLLEVDRSTVSRLESGDIKLVEKRARRLDREWSTDRLFTSLVRLAKEGHNREWFQIHNEMEARASELRIWEVLWIPGLLQTEAYTRAQVVSAGLDDIDKRVSDRMKRQECLTRKPPPYLWVILDQGVLTQPVGSSETMRGQLARLIEASQMPNISVRVVPQSEGAHVGRDGSFKLMTVDGAESAYIEASEEGRLVQDATDVRSFRRRFDRIGDHALPVRASIDLIERVMEGFQ